MALLTVVPTGNTAYTQDPVYSNARMPYTNPTLVVTPQAHFIRSEHTSSYATMRSGSSLAVDPTGAAGIAGQAGFNLDNPPYNTGYEGFQTFVDFDTSSIPVGATISAVSLGLYYNGPPLSAPIVVECYLDAFGTLTTADWVPGASVGGLTLLASLPISLSQGNAQIPMTLNGSNLLSSIVKGGHTQMMLTTDGFRLGTVPPFAYFEYATLSSITLTVTYTNLYANEHLLGSGVYKIGQELTGGNFDLYEMMLLFDTSAVPVNAVISSAVLRMKGSGGTAAQTFLMEARVGGFHSTIVATDFVNGTDLAAATLLATFDSAGWDSGGVNNNNFIDASGNVFGANINIGGTTRVIVSSSRLRTGNAPASGAAEVWPVASVSLDITYSLPVAKTITFDADFILGNPRLATVLWDSYFLGTTQMPITWDAALFPPSPIPRAGRIRTDIYSPSGSLLSVGPLIHAGQLDYTNILDALGNFTLTLPATDPRASLFTQGTILRFYREGEGLVYVGITDKCAYAVVANGTISLQVTGASLGRQLVYANCLLGRTYNDAVLAAFMSNTGAGMLVGTGWSPGRLDTTPNNILARLDMVSIWDGILAGAQQLELHVRENPLYQTVDVGAFGLNPHGITFANVETVPPVLPLPVLPVRTNFVLNGGFELDTSNWFHHTGTGESFTRITSDHAFGTACMEVDIPTGFGQGVVTSGGAMAVSAGVYTASAYFKAKTVGDIGKTIQFYFLEDSATFSIPIALPAAWTRYSVPAAFTGGSGAVIHLLSDVGQAVGFLVDGIQVEAGSVATDYIDTYAQAVTVGGPASPHTNHVYNGGFEIDTAGWFPGGGDNAIARTTTDKVFGAASLAVFIGVSGNVVQMTTDMDGLNLTGTYTLSFYVKASGGSVGRTLNVYNSPLGGRSLSLPASWARFSFTYTFTGSGTLLFGFYDDLINPINFLVDGVQFEEGTVATDYIDTSVGAVTEVITIGNPLLYPVSTFAITEESADLWNTVIPLGGGTGVNQLDLRYSDRSVAGGYKYDIISATGPDGNPYYFLQDSASVAIYGVRTQGIKISSAIAVTNDPAGQTAAANALYDLAVTYLVRHKDAQFTYDCTPEGLPDLDQFGTPLIHVGDKVHVDYRGWTTDPASGLRVAWKTVNADCWVISSTRSLLGDGGYKWKFVLSTVDRMQDTIENRLIQVISQVTALAMTPKPATYQMAFTLINLQLTPSKDLVLTANFDPTIIQSLSLAKLDFIIAGGTGSPAIAVSINGAFITGSPFNAVNSDVTVDVTAQLLNGIGQIAQAQNLITFHSPGQTVTITAVLTATVTASSKPAGS